MAGRIVLISDESDFFEYIRQKLELRKSDELFTFSFDSVPEKISFIDSSVLIVNSENSEEKTLDLLNILRGTPVIVFAFNEDEVFRRKCYRAGMFDFMTILTPDAEFRARMIPALSVASILDKNKLYRDVLVKQDIINRNNEVFTDYNFILDKELEDINNGQKNAIFAAVAPSDKSKFMLTQNMIETAILDNIRRNDILMNYAPNKYFLLMFDTNIKSAESILGKINTRLPHKIYAGFTNISNQKRQQLINEVLNKLHSAINNSKEDFISTANTEPYTNFKQFRQEFERKIEQTITPVFYQLQQKYSGKILGITIQQETKDGFGVFNIKGKVSSAGIKITSAGFSKINIDITYQKNASNIDAKRITLNPDELEAGFLEDLLEQFILEYKRGLDYDNS